MPRTSPVYVSEKDRAAHRRVLERRADLVRDLAVRQMEGGELEVAARLEERAALLDHSAFWLGERR